VSLWKRRLCLTRNAIASQHHRLHLRHPARTRTLYPQSLQQQHYRDFSGALVFAVPTTPLPPEAWGQTAGEGGRVGVTWLPIDQRGLTTTTTTTKKSVDARRWRPLVRRRGANTARPRPAHFHTAVPRSRSAAATAAAVTSQPPHLHTAVAGGSSDYCRATRCVNRRRCRLSLSFIGDVSCQSTAKHTCVTRPAAAAAITISVIMPPPTRRLSDVCLSVWRVCLSRTLGLSREQRAPGRPKLAQR